MAMQQQQMATQMQQHMVAQQQHMAQHMQVCMLAVQLGQPMPPMPPMPQMPPINFNPTTLALPPPGTPDVSYLTILFIYFNC